MFVRHTPTVHFRALPCDEAARSDGGDVTSQHTQFSPVAGELIDLRQWRLEVLPDESSDEAWDDDRPRPIQGGCQDEVVPHEETSP